MDIFEKLAGTPVKISTKKTLQSGPVRFARASGGYLIANRTFPQPKQGKYSYVSEGNSERKGLSFMVRIRTRKLYNLLRYKFFEEVGQEKAKELEKEGKAILLKQFAYTKNWMVISTDNLEKALFLIEKGVNFSEFGYAQTILVLESFARNVPPENIKATEVCIDLLKKLHACGMDRIWFGEGTVSHLGLPFVKDGYLVHDEYQDIHGRFSDVLLRMPMDEFREYLDSREHAHLTKSFYEQSLKYPDLDKLEVAEKLLILFEEGRMPLTKFEAGILIDIFEIAEKQVPQCLKEVIELNPSTIGREPPPMVRAERLSAKKGNATEAREAIDEIFSRALETTEKTDE